MHAARAPALEALRRRSNDVAVPGDLPPTRHVRLFAAFRE